MTKHSSPETLHDPVQEAPRRQYGPYTRFSEEVYTLIKSSVAAQTLEEQAALREKAAKLVKEQLPGNDEHITQLIIKDLIDSYKT